MSTIKSILLHMDASPDGATRLRSAMQLARSHDAELTVAYAVQSSFMQYPYTVDLSPEAAAAYQQCDEERLARTKALFDAAVGTAASHVRWVELADEPVSAFSRQALYADLLVLARDELHGAAQSGRPPDFNESVLIHSGTPALVLPRDNADETLGRVALIAWKETRESARAVRSALPFLQLAERVEVATWGAYTKHSNSALDIESLLRGHGIAARVHRYGKETSELGEYLLSMTVDVGADLLVMGCYGHSRTREWVLGGVTRTVLNSLTLPVLMAH